MGTCGSIRIASCDRSRTCSCREWASIERHETWRHPLLCWWSVLTRPPSQRSPRPRRCQRPSTRPRHDRKAWARRLPHHGTILHADSEPASAAVPRHPSLPGTGLMACAPVGADGLRRGTAPTISVPRQRSPVNTAAQPRQHGRAMTTSLPGFTPLHWMSGKTCLLSTPRPRAGILSA